MSLVICSNKSGNLNTSTQNNQRPFSFVNNLKQTHQIPKGSEIAVQSVKITKDGLIEISEGDRFYSWFGEHLNRQSLTSPPQQPFQTTCHPIATQPFLENGETEAYVNIEEFNRRLTEGMKLGMPHPDMFGDGGDGVVQSDLQYSSGFQGFQMNYKYNTSLGTTNVFNDHNKYQFLDTTTPGMTITDEGASGTKFVCTRDADLNNLAWGYDKPISHMGGRCVFDLSGLRNASNGFGPGADASNPGGQDFMVGLARYCNGIGKADGSPGYFSADGPAGDRSDVFYDYAVSCEQLTPTSNYYLKIYQCVADFDGTGGVHMQEVQYYRGQDNPVGPYGEWSTSPFSSGTRSGRINLSSNASSIKKIGFQIENEKIKIYYETDAGAEVILTSTQYIASPHLAGKGNYPVPSRITNWNMYPKVMLTNGIGTHNFLTLDAYQGRVMKIGTQVFRGGDSTSDWFNRMENNGTDYEYAIEVDTRFMCDLSDLTTIYTQHGYTSASGIMDNYEQILILKQDNTNYLNTEGANMEDTLGFKSRAILDWAVGTADTDRGIKYVSDTQPSLINDNSLFIRLNNFTNRSINAGTGRPSKILYHIPRFDTSGREYGTGLYFEPQERVYVALNNSEDLFINEFALDVCQDDEILASDLVGETIICLHIRDSKM